MKNKVFLENAERIGHRLIEMAIWKENTCTWIVNAPDRENRGSRKSIKEQADVGIYQGVSGIALFLLELYKITNDKKLLKTIEGALHYIKLGAEELTPNNFAFHGGRVGVGYTFYKAYQILCNEELLLHGLNIIEPLGGNEFNDYGLDVIGGSAGAIPALLKMAEISGNDFELVMAIALGENLITKANKEPVGWSWGGGNTHIRNLCGYAHGASGMAHAFLELYNFSADGKYLYAAEQAFLYERQFINQEKCNWPDFRYSELSEFIYENRIEQLKEAIQTKTLPPYENKYMYAWCHGSPGIALSRLRAYEITGLEAYKKEADIAVEGTKISLPDGYNYSLCHGIGGNSEALIYASQILGDKNALKMAEEYALRGIQEFEEQNKPWKCGTMGGVSDPSLMLGEAGIGYYLLRLYSSGTDSVLLLQPSLKRKTKSGKDSLRELRERYTDVYFSKTKKYLKLLGGQSLVKDLPAIKEMIGKKESDVELIYINIQKLSDSFDDEEKNKFEDLFQLEKKRYLQTLKLTDYTEEFIHDLVKQEAEQIVWQNSELCLSNTPKIIKQKYDWANWLEKINEKKIEEPDEDEQYYILYRQSNQFHFKKLNSFLALLFNTMRQPVSFAKIYKEIKNSLDDNTQDIEVLKEIIKQQLIAGYNSNIIKVEK